MSERIMIRGMLAEKKAKYRELKNLADGYIISLRNLINPYIEIQDLAMDLIRAQVIELGRCWEKIRSIKEEIEKMEQDLNG